MRRARSGLLENLLLYLRKESMPPFAGKAEGYKTKVSRLCRCLCTEYSHTRCAYSGLCNANFSLDLAFSNSFSSPFSQSPVQARCCTLGGKSHISILQYILLVLSISNCALVAFIPAHSWLNYLEHQQQ